ncbi:hypothetical protein FACS1894164_18000 [Spirochaetia bacterium]|nr:hypothetical protein FACS1894164_18000 [Spirochaetia bacterium]
MLEPALKGRRLIAYGGLFKTVKRRLKLEDEAGEGVNQAEVDAMIRDPLIEKLVYRWNCGMKVYNVEIIR